MPESSGIVEKTMEGNCTGYFRLGFSIKNVFELYLQNFIVH